MDIERMKKLLESGIEAGNKVKAVREVVKTYTTQKQDMYDDTAEMLKPSIDVQKSSVKETIDNKRDELIEAITRITNNVLIEAIDKVTDMNERASIFHNKGPKEIVGPVKEDEGSAKADPINT